MEVEEKKGIFEKEKIQVRSSYFSSFFLNVLIRLSSAVNLFLLNYYFLNILFKRKNMACFN